MKMDDSRLGGMAGILSAVLLVPAFALLVTMEPGNGAERTLGNFEARPGTLSAVFGLFLLTQALYIVFLASLYRTLQGNTRMLARISFQIGGSALVLGMLSLHLLVSIIHLLGPSQTTGSLAGTDLLEALYLGLSTLAMAGGTASILFVGLSIFGYGIAMLAASSFEAPFAYGTIAAGLLIFTSVLFHLFPWPVLIMYGYGAVGGAVLWGHAAKPAAARDRTGMAG